MSKGMIRPNEAHERAAKMRELAADMESLLNDLHNRMDQIGDVGAGLDAGTTSATQTREEFEELVQKFPGFYDQIVKFSNDVDVVANSMVQQ